MVSPVFGMGLTEILLVGIVVLLLFSPKELPGMIKGVARFYGSLRRTAEDFRAQVMEAEELREPLDEIRDAYRGTKAQLTEAQGAARRELAKARLEARMAEQRLARLAREESDLASKEAAAKSAASSLPEGADEGPQEGAAPESAAPRPRPTAAPTKRPSGGDDPDERGAA